MKKLYNIIACGLLAAATTSCSLNYEPEELYSDVTEGVQETEAKTAVFKNREDVYNYMNIIDMIYAWNLECWYLDQMVVQEIHSDNCYAGSEGSECTPMERNAVDATVYILERDWNLFLSVAAEASKLIYNIDKVADNSLTQDEINTCRAQAEILRAMVRFDMVRLWGNIPIVNYIPENITSENMSETYPQYFVSQVSEEEAYRAIEADLLDAVKYAPAQTANKNKLSVNVARTLLAKLYAEKPLRDYEKVKKYVDEIEADGFVLNDRYADFWENDGDPKYVDGASARPLKSNTPESIYEATFSESGGLWMTWIFYYDEANINGKIDDPRWCTPSRGLIKAFEDEGDTERYEQAIKWSSCYYTKNYPADHYPFLYKARSRYTNVIKFRFADVLLLKAEAMIMGQNPDLEGAARIIDRVRERVHLPKLAANIRGNKDALLRAYLNERRLELAFEQQRWYDLLRLDMMEIIMNEAVAADPLRNNANPYTERDRLLPIHQNVLDKNSNLVQNPGY